MSSNKSNFLVQGSILAIAGVLVRIIGIIYRVPVNNILGDEGVSYYSAAYDIYSLFLLISSMSMPIAVSKIVAARVATGKIKDAYRAFIGALVLGIIIGTVVFFVVFFGADGFASLWGYPSAAYAVRVLAPTLFIMSILGVLRGFLQGMGTMIPTAMSQILEQVANAIVSITGAMYLFKAGAESGKSAAYAAAGSTLGTLTGAFFALIFLIIVFVIYRPVLLKKMSRDRLGGKESYRSIYSAVITTVMPVILSTAIYNLSSILDSGVFGNISSRVFGMKEAEYSSLFGIYTGAYRLLTTAPIAMASALSSAIIPSLIRSVKNNDMIMVRKKIESSLRLTMIVAIPAGIGLSVLGKPVLKLLFRGMFSSEAMLDYAGKVMILSIVTVVVFSVSTITNATLQGIDKMKLPIINSSIALVIHYIFLVAMLLIGKPNLYAVVLGDIVFGFAVCVLNGMSMRKYAGYKQEIKKTFLKPLGASAAMAAVTLLVYKVLEGLTKSNTIACIIAIIAAVAVYGVVLLLIKGIDEEEILMLPKGDKILAMIKKTHLM